MYQILCSQPSAVRHRDQGRAPASIGRAIMGSTRRHAPRPFAGESTRALAGLVVWGFDPLPPYILVLCYDVCAYLHPVKIWRFHSPKESQDDLALGLLVPCSGSDSFSGAVSFNVVVVIVVVVHPSPSFRRDLLASKSVLSVWSRVGLGKQALFFCSCVPTLLASKGVPFSLLHCCHQER